jgi:hypothetical protein
MTKISLLTLLTTILMVAIMPTTSFAQPAAPPHVFVGKATSNDVPAINGTLLTAWVEGTQAGAATANNGDGTYSMLVEQPAGIAYSGKTILFKIGGVDATQTAIWEQGGANILNLTTGNPAPTATIAPEPIATQAPTVAPTVAPTPIPTTTQEPTTTAVPEPTTTALPEPTATPQAIAIVVPTATAKPEPVATLLAPTMIPTPNPTPTSQQTGGSGCSLPVGGSVPLDGGWLLLGLIIPGLIMTKKKGWID